MLVKIFYGVFSDVFILFCSFAVCLSIAENGFITVPKKYMTRNNSSSSQRCCVMKAKGYVVKGYVVKGYGGILQLIGKCILCHQSWWCFLWKHK